MGLVTAGVSTFRVRAALSALRRLYPEVRDPLSTLKVYVDRRRMVVSIDGVLIEPISGQLLMLTVLGELVRVGQRVGARVLPMFPQGAPVSPTPQESDDPDRWFDAGAQAQALGQPPERAEACYRAALELDPKHVGALLNLGNVCYTRGALREAAGLYRRATLVEPTSAEGHYNLANVLDDLNQHTAALRSYARALELEPAFPAAHFNVALVLEKLGERGRARLHWRRYLDQQPDGPSAEVARGFLDHGGPNPRLPLSARRDPPPATGPLS